MSQPIVNSYFSGMGLIDLGLARAGLRIGQSFELDPVCCETQRLNFRHEVVACAAYRMIGTAVAEPVAHWIGREVLRYFGGRITA